MCFNFKIHCLLRPNKSAFLCIDIYLDFNNIVYHFLPIVFYTLFQNAFSIQLQNYSSLISKLYLRRFEKVSSELIRSFEEK